MLTLPTAVYSEEHSPDRSERYVHIQTSDLLPSLEELGFTVFSSRVHARSQTNPYARHVLDLRIPGVKEVNGTVPRVLLQNSHNGTKALKAMLGAWRWACENGMVAGDVYGEVTIRHSGVGAAEAIDKIRALAANTKPLFDSIKRWSDIAIQDETAAEFARLASVLRWGDAERFSSEQILQVRRAEDQAPDLWTVFNRVQENTVKGAFEGVNGKKVPTVTIEDLDVIDALMEWLASSQGQTFLAAAQARLDAAHRERHLFHNTATSEGTV